MPRLLLALVCLIVAFGTIRAGEAAEALKMTVRPGLDGSARLGTWFPVEVQVANTGPDLVGEIQVRVDGLEGRGALNRPPVVYSVPAVLPRQSSKRFVLDVYMAVPIEKVAAKLVSGGDVITTADAPIERVGQAEMLCGVLSGNRGVLDFLPAVELNGRQRKIRLARLEMTDLPAAPQLLSSLDCLVLSNVSLAGLGDEQKKALSAWTAAGGTLVVAGGPGWQKTVSGLPPGLLPVEVVGTTPLRSAQALGAFFGEPIEDPGPWLAAQAQPTDGAVLLAEGNVPLIVAARRGQGAVFFLALDPALEPLRSWRGSAQLWRYIAGYVPGQVQIASNFVRPYMTWGRVPRGALADLSPLRPPSVDWLPAALLLYALVAGPLAYVLLRRLGRLEWGIWLLPGLTGIASLGTFGVVAGGGESDLLFNKISLVRSWGGQSDGYARTYVTAFSPREGTYDVELAPQGQTANAPRGRTDALVWPMFYPFPAPTTTPTIGTPTPGPPLVVQQTSNTTLTGYALDTRSLGSFQVDHPARLDGALETKLVLGGGSVTGTIANKTRGKLFDASMIVGSDVLRIGDIAAGETRSVALALGDSSPVGYVDVAAVVRQLYPNPAVATPVTTSEVMSREILESALNVGFQNSSRLDLSPLTLVAWLDRAPLVLAAREARSTDIDRALLVATLPLEPQSGEDLRIPPALIERRNLIANTARVNQSGIAISNGDTALFEYILPTRPDSFAIDQLALDVSAAAPGGFPTGEVTVHVYDWPAADWRELRLVTGVNPLADADRLVSGLGQMRVRLTYRTGQSSATLTVDRFELVVRGRGR